MIKRDFYRINLVPSALIIILIITGCSGGAPEPVAEPSTIPSAPPTIAITETVAEPEPVADAGVLYHDDFTNPATAWPEEKFDNYFIGYHEPEYYHIEITSPNYKTAVFEPGKQTFSDVTIEVKVFTASSKTSETGDFNFGPVFRRSGDQYYAFAISQRAKKWYVLKSSPNALTVLAEGTDENIHDPDVEDVLRVDAQGPNFSFHINDRLVSQVTDDEFEVGEIGLFVQTIDSTAAHIHFDDLTVRTFEESPPLGTDLTILYHDDFTNPATDWPEKKFDNYFIGYHEPEYYHIEITSPNYKTVVFEPGKQTFSDVTIEVKVFTASSKTSETGDFDFGPVFRRSGDQYYAFAISQRAKKWYVLKSSPNALTVLAEGTDENIHDPDVEDVLRVDAQGPNFSFHINDQLVSQVKDDEYDVGEIGLYVQTFDSTAAHIHFDALTVRTYEASIVCEVRALTLNVRSGPGTEFESSRFLSNGDTVEPLGLSVDGEWLQIGLEGSENPGWVFNSAEYLSCIGDVDLLPTTPP
jgi:hypothetical protein